MLDRNNTFLVVDDVQWADGGTAALLFHLGRRLAGSRILLVCAYRPEALHEPLDPEGPRRPLGRVLQELVRVWGDIQFDLDRSDGRAFVEALPKTGSGKIHKKSIRSRYWETAGNDRSC